MGLSYNPNAEGLLHNYGFNQDPQSKCSKSTVKNTRLLCGIFRELETKVAAPESYWRRSVGLL